MCRDPQIDAFVADFTEQRRADGLADHITSESMYRLLTGLLIEEERDECRVR